MALEEKNPTRNMVTGLMIAVSGYNYGYNIPILNSMATPIFCGHFKMSEAEKDSVQGTLNFLFCAAAIVGGASLGYFNRVFGRIRAAMILDTCLLVIAALFQFDSIWALVVARVAGGVVTGMYTLNAAIILVDLLPKSLSGPCYMVQNMLFGTFMLISFVQQIVLSQRELTQHWKLILSWPQLISVVRLAYFFCTFKAETPESVYEHFSKHPQLTQKLKESFSLVYKDTGLDTHVEQFIRLKSTTAQDSTSVVASTLELFSPGYISKTIGCLWLVLAEALTGYPFLILFSTVFFDRLGVDGKLASLILGTFNVLGPFVGMFTVNRYSRKGTMVVCLGLQACAFFAMWVCVLLGLVWPVAVSLAVFMTAYFVGIGPLHVIYIAEVLPTQAFSLVIPIGWFLWGVVGKISVALAAFVGESTTLLGYGGLCVFFSLLLHRLLIEQKTNHAAPQGDLTEVPLLG